VATRGIDVANNAFGFSQMGGAVLNGIYRSGVVLAALSVFMMYAPTVRAQESDRSPDAGRTETTDRADSASSERQAVGTVTSVGRGSIVVHTDEGRFRVYALPPSFIRVPMIEPGARVRVTTEASDSEPAPTALSVETLPQQQGLAQRPSQTPPPDVQRLQAQIEREARRFRIGLNAGVALDPELISINGFTTFTPFLQQRRLTVRPGLELAFGEVTTLLALNIEGLYMLPGLSRSIRWAPYVGAGPNFTFSHRSVNEEDFISDINAPPPPVDDDRFDFSQWDWNNGFNFIVGARNPGGTFFEMKGTAWGVASIRVLGGFEF
jgi:hypothetical protein